MAILPPGLTGQQFEEALKRFRAIVGADWVFTSEDDLATYRDSYSPFWDEPEERLAAAAVAPDSTEQVQALVRVANDLKVPIYPISTGKNLGYGGAAPNLSGSVIVDLKRMNRVIEVDSTRCFALVEPGVSYFDLYSHLKDKGLDLWIDCPEPGWGSVIGNALDRGVGYTSQNYRDHFGAHCGMEVVLANGELMRTGMGALPGAATWQDYKYGFGPYVDGLFSQGNFGIVTKMGIHLMPRPQAMSAGVIEAKNYADIIPLLEVLNRLEMSGLCDGMPQITSPVTGTLGAKPDLEITRVLGMQGGPTPDELARIAGDRPFWNVRVLSYGPPVIAKAKWEHAKEEFRKKLPECRFIEEVTYDIPLTPEQEEALEPYRLDLDRKVNFGIPNLGIFAMGARSPAFPAPSDGHLWFSAVIPRSGEGVMKAQNVFCKAIAEMGVYVGFNAPVPLGYTPHTFIMIFPIFISKTNAEMSRKGLMLLKHLIMIAAENGWGEYRAAPALQDFILDRYSFNDHAYRRFCEQLKDAVDPNGILAAGRYGIWPKHIRDERK
ncbi:FAD-binding oxidoreductase [Rhizobium alvei]|uniref:FAD-binding oxidoreductase n=1 Tax=Rhizobium alvei TaxID=1132659 RepID=A0ABT8YR04_9HYPH|nr:FAD-binding oxidoreductase [Rhizobium alvei]MDO6966154.1 FAD-binding oxidoreductase [Rhizobium alvei]